ncbi:hypothetical protein [Actinacidiphila acididurans]|uniref:Uncharacterized protein n=1 Tax=Actinacidiphila acididurans TaxID=2784346 RepID=A0ABS2TNX5_9ACTN|nr:hypothetical protein [Actinacidiphila acididurans]MBM9504532.1 hypothetical protein [Actinacidiphila acididurans]
MPDTQLRPFFELRIGGLHITAERFPVRLVTAIITAAASGIGTWLVTLR